ncbi:hypothetical protein ASPFODRAFT_46988 [Aspergillus luchuensis CBS 106.47]|uniref:Acetamidase n=1 Tax=Aspergillus luchuensis (strain CBS 106.47) TaxID=1137211 RepID=A0A1M3TGP9_ASPLC|nr:hypothetical protein ASPFODRAFT_46988 [Aspergillus luchuensis CBS 106.47]
MQQSEVLVHISAPSTVADDAGYRAQVEAILSFQPFSRQLITLRSDDSEAIPAVTEAGPSYTQEQHNASSSTLKPPDPGAASPAHRPSQHDKDSLGTPLSVIPDSQPERIPPEPVDLQEIALPQPSPTPRRKSTDTNGLPPTKRSRLDSLPPVIGTTSPDEHLNNLSLPNNDTTREAAPQTPKDITLHLPLEIKPNPPPISTNPFTTHITPTLEMLSTRLNPSRTYTPLQQTRPLDDLERGHWYLRLNLTNTLNPKPNSSTTWDMPLFTRFWTFLTDFIAKEGRAGWGVWCVLEDDGSDKPAPSPQNGPEDGGVEKPTRPVTLKVYAWGEIASHIYLLLFLASERRVRRMGLQWRDSADDVVIQMP